MIMKILSQSRFLSWPVKWGGWIIFCLLVIHSAAIAATPVRKNVSTVKRPGAQPVLTPSGPADLNKITCGNWIYAGNKSSVCFADRFLVEVTKETHLDVSRSFYPVRLDSDTLFDFPFSVFSGEDSFSLTPKERENFRKYLLNGGFIMVSPGCSDANWDRSFRNEFKICFPDRELVKIPMTHPIFSTVHIIPRLSDKTGRIVQLEGLEVNGKLALVYSKEGLNDVGYAKGCCCCGGNEVRDPVKVNINVITYALLY